MLTNIENSLINKQVECGNSLEVLSNQFTINSVELILSDIPYGIGAEEWDVLHKNTNSAYRGSSPAQAKAGTVFKNRGKPINGWSDSDRAIPKEYYDWCSTWAPLWLDILKPGGSVFIFAGRRFAHRCISALEDAGFSFKDMIAWEKRKAPHRAQRVSKIYSRRGDEYHALQWQGWRVGNLRPTFEPICWFMKPYRMGGTIADNILDHGVGAFNQNAFSKYSERTENIIRADFRKGESGFHSAQKPIDLMAALIDLTTSPGQFVLDPFCGSGSTLVAAQILGRKFFGIDADPDCVNISKSRLNDGLF